MNRIVLSTVLVAAGLGVANAQSEPPESTWPTWVLSSGRQFRLDAPAAYGDQRNELNG